MEEPSLSLETRRSSRGGTLVWGACGFIGQHLTSHLVQAGERVTVLIREQANRRLPSWAPDVEWVTFGPQDDFDSVLDRAVSNAAVIHNLAGSSGAVASNRTPMESMEANCAIQLRFLKACAKAGHKPHVVFPSSRLVYGPTGASPVAEEQLPNPQSMYAVHKLCIEHYLEVASYLGQITHTICRITNPYGFEPAKAITGYKILNLFVSNAAAREPITIFGEGRQLRDFIHISDLVRCLYSCGKDPAAINQTFNIGSGVSRTLVEAAQIIHGMTGTEIRYSPWPEDYLVVESGDHVSDVGKAKRVLNFIAELDLEAGLRKTLEAYQAWIPAFARES